MSSDTRRVLLGVHGMDDAQGRERVRRALLEVPGVEGVEVDEDGQAAVSYDGGEATVMDLIRALRRIGFLAGME